jgi:hypothetical protein
MYALSGTSHRSRIDKTHAGAYDKPFSTEGTNLLTFLHTSALQFSVSPTVQSHFISNGEPLDPTVGMQKQKLELFII